MKKNAYFINEKAETVFLSADIIVEDGIQWVSVTGKAGRDDIDMQMTVKEAMKIHQLLSELELPKTR